MLNKNDDENQSRPLFFFELIGAILLIILCFNFKSLFKSVYFYTFMNRDIERARDLLSGQLIFFGPETSGGGYLPGPLIYVLLALPLFFFPFWQSCFFMLLNFVAGMALGGWLWFRKRLGTVAAFTFLILLTLSYPSRSFVLLFLNVSYMLPFALVGILAASAAFSDPDPRRRARAFLLACVMVGLGLQLHFSILCLALAMLFMQALGPRLGLLRVDTKSALIGTAALCTCLAPYGLWRALQAVGLKFGQQGSYLGEAPGSLTTLLMLADYSSDVPLETTVQELALRIFAIVPLVLILTLMALLANALYEKWRGLPHSDNGGSEEDKRNLRATLWILFWGFFPFSYVFLVHMGRRYGMVFCLSLIIATILLQARLLKVRRATVLFNVFAIAALVFLKWVYFEINEKAAINWLAKTRHLLILILPMAFVFYSVRRTYKHAAAVMLSVFLIVALALIQRDIVAPRGLREKKVPRFHNEDWVKIWRTIHRETGWSYRNAIQRIFFVNLRLDEDPRPGYEQVARGAHGVYPGETRPDGFFILNTKYLKKKGDRGAYRKFLAEQRIPQEIKDGIASGDIELGEPMYEGTMVLPYRVKSTEKLPRYFHNLGQGYKRHERDLILDQIPGTEGTLQLGNSEWLFKWNECADLNPFCSTGMVVKTEPAGKGRLKVTVDALGSAISQNSPWVSPSWTQAWIEPYIELGCGSRVEKRVLFSSIGLMRQYGSNEFNELLQANNSLVAPLRREFEVDKCARLTEISAGRAASRVERLVESKELPARRLSVHLEPTVR
ncbi:MAG: hypothetical protein KF799_04795 [Bdellovibrionales bacterium]|nr:hypothetical protein [Bdellovibrionales bacterium]